MTPRGNEARWSQRAPPRIRLRRSLFRRLPRLGGLLARTEVEDAFPQPQVLRRDLDELVAGDVFDRALVRELGRRREAGGDTLALGTEIREFLFAHRVHGDVLVA